MRWTLRVASAVAVSLLVLPVRMAAAQEFEMPDTGPTAPGGETGAAAGTIWGWVQFGGYALCTVGIAVGGMMYWIAKSKGQAQDGNKGLVVAGCAAGGAIFIAIAASLIETISTTF